MQHPNHEILRAGMLALREAKVEPLGLDIRPGGEWSFYQFFALPGHPSPGNAGHGFSHPHPILGDAFAFSSGRIGRARGGALLSPIDKLDDAAIHAWCADVARSIWPGCPHESTVERCESDGVLYGVAITRRITDEVRLVATALRAAETMRIMLRGGDA